jgi:prophage antirepressor-like protein
MKADDDRNTRVALFQKREIRRTIHDGEWWFVITDVIAALTDSPDPAGYWKKMRKRDPPEIYADNTGSRLICVICG